MEYYSAVKKNKITKLKKVDLESVTVSEVTQYQKEKKERSVAYADPSLHLYKHVCMC